MKAQMNRLNSADHVIFVSKDIQRAAIKKGANPQHFSVVPNGISDIFNNKSRKQTKKLVIGFVGLLTPIKRADKLIEIFNNVLQIINIDQFLIIGKVF